LASGFGKIRLRGHLERQPDAARLRAAFQRDRQHADLAREPGAFAVACGQRQSDYVGEIVDRLVKIGRLEGGVADASGLDHGVRCRFVRAIVQGAAAFRLDLIFSQKFLC
jgi:hypothetical protein